MQVLASRFEGIVPKYSAWTIRYWVVALLALPLASVADTVERYSSKVPLRGRIVAENAREIRIQVSFGGTTREANVPLDDVAAVQYDGPVGLALLQAQTIEKSRNYHRALARYQQAVRTATGGGMAARALEFGLVRVQSLLALGQRDRLDDPPADALDDCITQLEQFRTQHPDSRFHYELYELLGRLYMKKGSAAKAQQAFDELGRSPWAAFQLRALNWHGRMLLEQGKFLEAKAMFDQVARADGKTDLERLCREEAVLLLGQCLQKLDQLDEAEKLLNDLIDQTPPEQSELQATAHNVLGGVLRQAGKTDDALLAYLYVDLLCSNQKEARCQALFYIAQLWKASGRPDRARDALEKLQRINPQSVWAKRAAEPVENTRL